MTEVFAKPELDRRTLLRRAAAVGLLATPAVGMLSACVGGGSDETQEHAEGDKSTTNPLGVDLKGPMEIIIFNGGLGTKYATDVHVPSYNKLYPEAKVAFSETTEIGKVVQPRINAGDPPDMDTYRPNDYDGVEVYRGLAQTPPAYAGTGAVCGTVLFWSRSR